MPSLFDEYYGSDARRQQGMEEEKKGGFEWSGVWQGVGTVASTILDTQLGGKQPVRQPSFFERNQTMVIGGGIAVLAVAGFMLMKK